MANGRENHPIWLGPGVAALGLGVIAAMTLDPGGLNAPLWVAVAAASAFVFAGLSFTAHSFGIGWLNRIANFLTVCALASPGFWIMLDPAPKACASGFSIVSGGSAVTFGAPANDWECRLVFGAGAILTALLALALVISAWRQWRRSRRH